MRMQRQFVSTGCILAGAKRTWQLGAARMGRTGERRLGRLGALRRHVRDVSPEPQPGRVFGGTGDEVRRPRGAGGDAGEVRCHPLPCHSLQRGWSGP